MIMSHIWLREPCGLYRTFIVLFLVTGVVFITKPPFIFTKPNETENYNVLGYVAALFGTVFTAMNIVVMRKCKDVHFSVVVFQFSFWSLVISSCILFAGGTPSIPDQTPTQWMLIVLVAVFGLSGQILVAIALTHEGAGRVAVTRSMDIVLAYVLQVSLLFHLKCCYLKVSCVNSFNFCVGAHFPRSSRLEICHGGWDGYILRNCDGS